MFRLIFRGHWAVQLFLACAAFAAAAFFYWAHLQLEAEKAQARAAGMPAAVSLNSFDPAKDVHPADEVHVIGWINPAFNYQLTEEHRKRSDVVRRMFVLFGPEDAPDAMMARAVLLMPEEDVDRFVEQVVANATGMVGGNPVFTLNGTGGKTATLDNMADDALREKGLTKAPGFRYLELWPAGGRDEGLRAAPEAGLYIAGPAAGFGVLMLGLGIVRFRRRNLMPAPSQTAATSAGQPWGVTSAAPAAAAEAAPDPVARQAPRKTPRLRPESWAFLIIAVLVGVVGNWSGSWQAMVLSGVLIVVHFIARVVAAMNRGVEAVATTLNALRTPAPDMAPVAGEGLELRAGDGRAPADAPSIIRRLFSAGPARGGRSLGFGGVMAVLTLGVLTLGNLGVLDMRLPGMPAVAVNSEAPDTASSPTSPDSAGDAPAAPTAVADQPDAAPQPATATAAKAAEVAPAASIETPLIPAAASLRPEPGETPPVPAVAEAATPAAPATTEPVTEAAATPAPETAAPAAPAPVAGEVAVAAPVTTEPATPEAAPAPVASAAPPEATTGTGTDPAPAAREATAEADAAAGPARPDMARPEKSVLAGLNLPGLGQLALLIPAIGAVLLAIAAFALMRGRQAAPPAVFAGRDPWEKLARTARGNT